MQPESGGDSQPHQALWDRRLASWLRPGTARTLAPLGWLAGSLACQRHRCCCGRAPAGGLKCSSALVPKGAGLDRRGGCLVAAAACGPAWTHAHAFGCQLSADSGPWFSGAPAGVSGCQSPHPAAGLSLFCRARRELVASRLSDPPS